MQLISPRVITANRGDLFSRWGILKAMSALTDSPIPVFCLDSRHLPPGDFSPLTYGPLYNAIPPLKGIKALIKSDVVVWTGGLDLQDDSSLIKLLHTLLVFISYRLLGLRIVLVMQGAGPITTSAGRWLTRRVLNRVDVALLRDHGSRELVDSLKSRVRIKACHDGIFLDGFPGAQTPATELEAVNRLTERPDGKPLIVINLRLWFHLSSGVLPYQFAQNRYRERANASMGKLIESTTNIISALRDQHDARILLVSMYEPGVEPWEDDLPYLQQVKNDSFAADDAVRVLETPLGIPAFYELMQRPDLVIGMRLHATLIALRAGIPALHLAYTLKGPDIYTDLGLEDLVLSLEDFMNEPERLIAMCNNALADTGLRERVSTAVKAACKENTLVLKEVFEEIAKGLGK